MIHEGIYQIDWTGKGRALKGRTDDSSDPYLTDDPECSGDAEGDPGDQPRLLDKRSAVFMASTTTTASPAAPFGRNRTSTMIRQGSSLHPVRAETKRQHS